ncbi:MAG: hypothetical protein ACEQSH_00945, partial [Bacteroidia bacterium]
MSVQSRKAVREEVGQMLTGRLSAAQQVYTDQPTSFNGQSPVVVVASNGSRREEQPTQRTFGGPIAPKFMLDVYVFILAAASNVDDALDDLEAAVAAFVAEVPRAQTWTAIGYGGNTETSF